MFPMFVLVLSLLVVMQKYNFYYSFMLLDFPTCISFSLFSLLYSGSGKNICL